jgi:hypothetical protein
MIRGRFRKLIVAITILVGGAVAVSVSQMPPENSSFVKNDSTATISFETQSGGVWTQQSLEPAKDMKIKADRIRVSTTRDDKALLTVDLPIQIGKKYRVFWNGQTSMWDLGGTT